MVKEEQVVNNMNQKEVEQIIIDQKREIINKVVSTGMFPAQKLSINKTINNISNTLVFAIRKYNDVNEVLKIIETKKSMYVGKYILMFLNDLENKLSK